MAKTHSIIVSDVVLQQLTLAQYRDDDDGTYFANLHIRGVVLDDAGDEVRQMNHLTRKNYIIASGSATPYTKAQLLANKDLIFQKFGEWADEMRLALANINPT